MDQETETTTITAKYINQPKPGKKMGSVKDAAGSMYFMYPEMLQNIQPGQTFMVDYTRSDKPGLYFVQKVHFGGVPDPQAPIQYDERNPPPPSQPYPSNAPSQPAPAYVPPPAALPATETDPTAENIFVTGVTQRAIQGLCAHMSIEDIVEAIPTVANACIKAWRGRGGT